MNMKGRNKMKKKLFIIAGIGALAALCLLAINHKREELEEDL